MIMNRILMVLDLISAKNLTTLERYSLVIGFINTFRRDSDVLRHQFYGTTSILEQNPKPHGSEPKMLLLAQDQYKVLKMLKTFSALVEGRTLK